MKKEDTIKSSSVLIIDDEEDICLLLSTFIQRKSKKVTYALTLNEGMKNLYDLQPNVVLLDNNLPDGLGITVIGKIRNLLPGCKIIMMSAMGHLSEEALITGADNFLEKPISFEVLSGLID
ncbi:Response regulator receiver domain-containing protein [Pseudarcicella hirudinis]|uniref:Response regulator receiver domain-containing protein n=1 Tax=Pseudarcicella hirudinis TaxID=1079859 RepID=A0A1I5XDG2_9BACT|nr:response regulator [Pseudarcicella hirudinis]SFQ30023.1 Response regulator receiver domain-containing protein [Pseudarcicella hirudinis]